MSLLSWIGRRIRLTDRAFWAAYYGGETWAGEAVSPDTAMQVTAFSSGVQLRARTVGTLPCMLYERTPGGRKARPDHYLYKLVHDKPNADQTAAEYWQGVEANISVYGNSFAEKIYRREGGRQLLIATMLLDPARMAVERGADGTRRYRYVDENGKTSEYREDQIFHARGFGFGGEVGLSPIRFGRQALSANRATDRAAASHFSNGMRGSGWLIAKNTLTQEQRDQARKSLIEPMSGAGNAGKTGILEGDFFDYKQMSIPPEAAQLLESRRFGVEEIARLLGIPPVLLSHSAPGQTMFGAGVGEVVRGWYKLWLRAELVFIAQSANLAFIQPEDREKFYFEFNPDALLQGDPAERGEFYWKLMQVGAITPNQICDKENFPRFLGGDRHFVNQTLAPLDDTGMPAIADPAPPAAQEPRQPPKLEVVR